MSDCLQWPFMKETNDVVKKILNVQDERICYPTWSKINGEYIYPSCSNCKSWLYRTRDESKRFLPNCFHCASKVADISFIHPISTGSRSGFYDSSKRAWVSFSVGMNIRSSCPNCELEVDPLLIVSAVRRGTFWARVECKSCGWTASAYGMTYDLAVKKAVRIWNEWVKLDFSYPIIKLLD